jgi:hypothetical protein
VKRNVAQIPKINDKRIWPPHGVIVATSASDGAILAQTFGRRYCPKGHKNGTEQLIDDPFRSLAGELRRAGGFAKDTTPFSEFLWADFLRRRMKRKAVEANFEIALNEALELAKSVDANHLPGWCGPVTEEWENHRDFDSSGHRRITPNIRFRG